MYQRVFGDVEVLFNDDNIYLGRELIAGTEDRDKYLYYANKICNAYQILIPDNFVHIKAGSFIMGSNKEKDETPHKVTLAKDFMVQTHTVTQKQWMSVMDVNPSGDRDDNNPVTDVSWGDAQEYINNLNLISEHTYRLPTEAEWEYCCRAGSQTEYCFGDSVNMLKEYAWYNENSNNKIHNVGLLKPNAFGLYDMHGNVCEWCEDWYGDYPGGDSTDPKGVLNGKYRVTRGGDWGVAAYYARSAFRNYDDPGVRLVRSI